MFLSFCLIIRSQPSFTECVSTMGGSGLFSLSTYLTMSALSASLAAFLLRKTDYMGLFFLEANPLASRHAVTTAATWLHKTAAHIPFSPVEESRQANGIRMIK